MVEMSESCMQSLADSRKALLHNITTLYNDRCPNCCTVRCSTVLQPLQSHLDNFAVALQSEVELLNKFGYRLKAFELYGADELTVEDALKVMTDYTELRAQPTRGVTNRRVSWRRWS
jgi:hypothetical protein